MKRDSTGINLAQIDPRRWERITDLLDAVLDVAPHEIGPSLDRLCGGDTELRAQVEAILEADRHNDGFLAKPAVSPAPELPQSVGSYRIVHEIGRGGMGRVLLGGDAGGRQVAIKLLKTGLDSEDIIARFLQERRILAKLEHPHIAKLLDGGVTEDGKPWFALEYVHGTPLDEYCDTRGATLSATLELFVQACRAVQAAHDRQIVHRDLKPGNILVCDPGDVKLLDFGIAKILDPDESDGRRSTGLMRLMTPTYAAPEQIRGERPTTATDVYALGVVLCELLTGERPYKLATGSQAETRAAILNENPEPPSVKLRRAAVGEGAPSADPRRAGWSERMSARLDETVLRALHKDPAARYPSAGPLADEIESILQS
jgi:serine/threonine protein kinase